MQVIAFERTLIEMRNISKTNKNNNKKGQRPGAGKLRSLEEAWGHVLIWK